MEPPIGRKEFLKIDKKALICQITDNTHAIKRYSQFLRDGGHSGGFHVYYDGPGFAKIPFFRHCSRNVRTGADDAGPGWRSPGVPGCPRCIPVSNGVRDNDLGHSERRVERTAGSDADNPSEILRQAAGGGYGSGCAPDADTVGNCHNIATPPGAHLRPMDGQGGRTENDPSVRPRAGLRGDLTR